VDDYHQGRTKPNTLPSGHMAEKCLYETHLTTAGVQLGTYMQMQTFLPVLNGSRIQNNRFNCFSHFINYCR